MEKELINFRYFEPCAYLLRNITADQLPLRLKEQITQEEANHARELYKKWCQNVEEYKRKFLTVFDTNPKIEAITQTCESALPSNDTTIEKWVNKMILDFKVIQRASIMIENDIRDKLKLPIYSGNLPELSYVSDLDNLLRQYKENRTSTGSSLVTKVTANITKKRLMIGIGIVIVIVLFIAFIVLMTREKMYNPTNMVDQLGIRNTVIPARTYWY